MTTNRGVTSKPSYFTVGVAKQVKLATVRSRCLICQFTGKASNGSFLFLPEVLRARFFLGGDAISFARDPPVLSRQPLDGGFFINTPPPLASVFWYNEYKLITDN